LAWFRDLATDHIGLAREVVEILRQHDVVVETSLTERPDSWCTRTIFRSSLNRFSETPT
jgi:hypothetical protein